jgi:hypothetical protein
MNYQGSVPLPPGAERAYSGRIDLQLPLGGSVTVADWSGTSKKVAGSGTYHYNVPSILPRARPCGPTAPTVRTGCRRPAPVRSPSASGQARRSEGRCRQSSRRPRQGDGQLAALPSWCGGPSSARSSCG